MKRWGSRMYKKRFEDVLADKEGLEVTGRLLDEHAARFDKNLKIIYGNAHNPHRLPSRALHNDINNAQFDKNRIRANFEIIKFLKAYKKINEGYMNQYSTEFEKERYEGITLLTKRNLLVLFCHNLFNASGAFKGKYKNILGPTPFTWETFEHFGSVMIDSSHTRVLVFQNSNNQSKTRNIMLEHHDKENIVEAAIDMIIENDADALMSFFEMLQKHHIDKDSSTVLKPHQFFGIRAITKRLLDTKTLVKLMSLTNNYRLSRAEVNEFANNNSNGGTYGSCLIRYNHDFSDRYLKLDTKMAVHAALRRIEMIGELLTGKYFSSAWKKHDESVDWDAFDTLRVTIAHQDEGDNRAKINTLISDKVQLISILNTDIPYLHDRLQLLCEERAKHEPVYQQNQAKQFCKELIDREQMRCQTVSQAPSAPDVKPAAKKKLTKAERVLEREKVAIEVAAKNAAREKAFKGLDAARKVAATFKTASVSNALLNPKLRIELALEALTNIAEFMKDTAGVVLDASVETDVILDALGKNEMLNDAINYNIEQFLQHLERIKEYDFIKAHPLIAKGYDQMRHLRNHVAHGALLLDTEDFNPQKEEAKYPAQQCHVAGALKALSSVFIPVFTNELHKMNSKSQVKP